MSAAINWLLTAEVKEAINDGVISEKYNNFNTPSISELEERIRALGEIDTYVVIRTLVNHRKELFVNILEYMNKKAQEGEKES